VTKDPFFLILISTAYLFCCIGTCYTKLQFLIRSTISSLDNHNKKRKKVCLKRACFYAMIVILSGKLCTGGGGFNCSSKNKILCIMTMKFCWIWCVIKRIMRSVLVLSYCVFYFLFKKLLTCILHVSASERRSHH
jgi:hypothetical protein